MEQGASDLTKSVRILSEPGDGSLDGPAAARVYDFLRPLAQRATRDEWHPDSPSTTDVVHRAFERLFLKPRAKGSPVEWRSSEDFLRVAARAMRNVLIEEARRRSALKRGGQRSRVPLEEITDPLRTPPHTLLELSEALDTLARAHERIATVIELRFFGGLTVEQVASILSVTDRTVRRDWDTGRLWLYRKMRGDPVDRGVVGE